jgi:RNA polymerase sigma-70 factor, ECF subfamily
MVMEMDVGELYELHASDLTRFATVLVGPSDAADVVSDAMVGVLASSSTAQVRDERGYLFRAVANAAKSLHRSGGRRRGRELRAVAASVPAGPQDQPSAVGGSVAAREVLAKLSEQQRVVMFLAYWMDLPAPEIAEMLDVGEGTVRKQLARGRDRLRRLLNDREVTT